MITFAVASATAFPLAAQAQATPSSWTYTVTPYLWLPNINGTLKYSVPPGTSGSPSVDTGPNSWLENLSFALMVSGEARRGKWSIVSDLIYLDFGDEGSRLRSVDFGGSSVSTDIDSGTRTSLSGVQWMLAAGYTMLETPRMTLDVLGGFRYFGVEAKADWQLTGTVSGPGGTQAFPASGGVTRRADLWDGIVGVRGRVRLGEGQWFFPYHLDIGAGASSFTWQALLGAGYGFKWGDVTLAYRHLAYDQSDDKLFQDFRFSGPALGATFRF